MTLPSSTNPKTERCGPKGEKNCVKTCILWAENACQKCQCLRILNFGVSQIHEIAIRLQLSAPNDQDMPLPKESLCRYMKSEKSAISGT
jgi:hypothetical protein